MSTALTVVLGVLAIALAIAVVGAGRRARRGVPHAGVAGYPMVRGVERCEVCGGALAAAAEDGCVPGNCRYQKIVLPSGEAILATNRMMGPDELAELRASWSANSGARWRIQAGTPAASGKAYPTNGKRERARRRRQAGGGAMREAAE